MINSITGLRLERVKQRNVSSTLTPKKRLSLLPLSSCLLGLFLALLGCKHKVLPESYNIIGNGLSIPNQTLYLLDAYSSEILDSTFIEGGNFTFSVAKDRIRSRLVAIRQLDESQKNMTLLRFPLADSRHTFHTWFFVEEDSTMMHEFEDQETKGYNSGYYAKVGGYENSLVRQFPHFDLSDSKLHDQKFVDYGRNIEQNSHSNFLVGCLFKNRGSFSKDDLKSLFKLFSNGAKDSFYGRILSCLFDSNVHPSGFSLADERVGLLQDVDRRTINIMAFQAEEVRPFISAAPVLDSLDMLYAHDTRVLFSNISTEKNPFAWRSSLQHYRPAWPQFVVDRAYLSVLRFKYNFRRMPLVVFTDQYGRVLRRIEGYQQMRVSDYQKLINVTLED